MCHFWMSIGVQIWLVCAHGIDEVTNRQFIFQRNNIQTKSRIN